MAVTFYIFCFRVKNIFCQNWKFKLADIFKPFGKKFFKNWFAIQLLLFSGTSKAGRPTWGGDTLTCWWGYPISTSLLTVLGKSVFEIPSFSTANLHNSLRLSILISEIMVKTSIWEWWWDNRPSLVHKLINSVVFSILKNSWSRALAWLNSVSWWWSGQSFGA